ncbi:hypothetical protein [Pseudomonas sp. AB12(2023)]|uniref:hypothetical protein n=1 Tax=Pseudomonas sp. AB12(2023) TaxID=3048597 RepID=UPI002B226250|nr:hypothetical protein [Pseudomonas sp. AB12(2023)]MEB0222169.1 hypothetical protein [Pseudomonas sp. AB12(2023)]
MTLLSGLDQTMEAASALADALDVHAVPCPTSRIRFVTWVLGCFEDAESLIKAAQDLPDLPSEFCKKYGVWVSGGCKTKPADSDE